MSQFDTDKIRADYPVSDTVSKYVKLSRDGREFKGCCPFHAENTPSFTVNDDKKFFHCFGCGAHGDVVDFVQNYHNVSFREACTIITGETPTPEGERRQRESVTVDYYAGIVAAKPPNAELWQAGKRTPEIFNPKRADDEKRRTVRYTPSMVFPYLDDNGDLLGYVLRVEYSREGEQPVKITPCIRYATLPNGTKGWTHWHFNEPRPLYCLPQLAEASPTAQVFICEGEKATDACARLLGVVAIGWPGGTNAVDKVDLSPLKGRKVVLWPDADGPGWKAMNELAALLQPIAAEVKIIDSRDHPEKGWDVADAERDGISKADTLAWGKERIAVWTPSPADQIDAPAATVEQKPAKTKTPKKANSSSESANSKPPKASSETPPVEGPPPISDDYINNIVHGTPDTDDDQDQWEPFTILGFNKGIYYYMPRGTQQLTELSASAHTKINLLQLAPMGYWEAQFPKKGGPDWDMAVNALLQKSARVGIFIADRVRGRGAWIDKGRAVVHLGPAVQVDGRTVKPFDVDSEFIYEAAQPLSLVPDVAASNDEANKLVKICERLTWENPLSAQLLAGWCVIAPVCGALNWRSHIWVTGPASAGKSTVMKRIIGQVVGPVALYVEGNTTEAGLRHSLQHDARPVIFDEAESEDRSQAAAMQKVLSLARIGSSGGEVVKGGQDGVAKTYSVRSCFCFSSINTAVSHHADETRISKLVLRRNEAPDRDEHYKALMRDISEWMTPDYAAKMFARSVENISTLLANAQIFTDAADVIVKNRRAADQIGPMLAGLYLCFSTRKITFDAALAWINERHWSDHAALDGSNDERKLLTTLMTHRVRVNMDNGSPREVTLGELCFHMSDDKDGGIYGLSTKDANLELGRNGIKFEPDTNMIVIANKAPALSKILENTPWSKDWMRPLRSLPDATPADSKFFSAGLTQKGTRFPVSLLRE
jgi:putative DNA primase/helicase